jgi:hypothetical protein
VLAPEVTVVTGEDDEGVVVEPLVAEGLEHPADVGVDVLQHLDLVALDVDRGAGQVGAAGSQRSTLLIERGVFGIGVLSAVGDGGAGGKLIGWLPRVPALGVLFPPKGP